MANSWFEFKQFTVHQDLCGMKVSTDACIQGALANQFLIGQSISTALDIGAGTGLLSLMLAQENANAHFKAIELEQDAFLQTQINFRDSKWRTRLEVEHCTVQNFVHKSTEQFDFIICNPPFFKNHLNAQEAKRNLARHNESLSKQDLAESISILLNENGTACILYPAHEWDEFEKIAQTFGLQLIQQSLIFPNYRKPVNRIVGFFVKNSKSNIKDTHSLFIRNKEENYSSEYQTLMSKYHR